MSDGLCHKYQYADEGNRIRLRHVPDYGLESGRFYAETYKIANLLFNDGKYGGVLNSVCTAQGGGVLFQSHSQEKNRARAKLVTAIWRSFRRYKIEGCTCSLATLYPADGDVVIMPGGVDNCAIHGFGLKRDL